MTHNIPKHVNTYLCHNHFKSLPGRSVEWTPAMIGIEKCVVCGHKAEHDVSDICLSEEDLARFVVCYFNEVARKYDEISKEEIEEVTEAWIHEKECGCGKMHLCGQCGFPLTEVRPGKYQCETPWCPSNQKEE
jgi:hypothetical protein